MQNAANDVREATNKSHPQPSHMAQQGCGFLTVLLCATLLLLLPASALRASEALELQAAGSRSSVAQGAKPSPSQPTACSTVEDKKSCDGEQDCTWCKGEIPGTGCYDVHVAQLLPESELMG